jgi:hypothetical protein
MVEQRFELSPLVLKLSTTVLPTLLPQGKISLRNSSGVRSSEAQEAPMEDQQSGEEISR